MPDTTIMSRAHDAHMGSIPALTVIQVARRAGSTPHAVRHYTRLGLLRADRNPDNGYRLYGALELARLRFICRARRIGYTLNEIRDIIRDAEQGRTACPQVRAILQRRVVENRQKLTELQTLQRRMESALTAWDSEPDGVPDGVSICRLIESLGAEDVLD